MNAQTIRSLESVPTARLAGLYAGVFGDKSLPWNSLLQREIRTGRARSDLSVIYLVSGELVGACLVNLGPSGLARIGPTAVLSTHRRRGVGQQLVKTAVHNLKNNGATHVTLEVAEDNAAAIMMYESVEFVRSRGLRTLSAVQADLQLTPSTLVTEAVSQREALDCANALRTVSPVYQRQDHYLETFTAGVASELVSREERHVGVLIQSGTDIMEFVVQADDAEALSCLLDAAAQRSWRLRVLHLAADDPILEPLQELGFSVSGSAFEMTLQTG